MTQSNQSTTASEDSVVEIEDPEPYFAKVPEWVIVSGVSPQAMALYAILIAHMNRKEGNRAAFPGMGVLATLLGFRRRQSVKPYIAELEAIKAISVVKERTGTGWRNRYILRRGVPADHAGPADLTEFHAIRRRTPDGGMCGTAHHGMGAAAHDPTCGPAHTNQTNSTRRSEQDESSKSSTPSRAHSDERAREIAARDQAKVNRRARRDWELPAKDQRAWLDPNNLALAEHIEEWVDGLYGTGCDSANMIDSMIAQGYAPMRVLNAALKEGRETHGLNPEDPLPPWLNTPQPEIPLPVWDDEPSPSDVSGPDPWAA